MNGVLTLSSLSSIPIASITCPIALSGATILLPYTNRKLTSKQPAATVSDRKWAESATGAPSGHLSICHQ